MEYKPKSFNIKSSNYCQYNTDDGLEAAQRAAAIYLAYLSKSKPPDPTSKKNFHARIKNRKHTVNS